MTPNHFITQWHKAVQNKDLAAVDALLAKDFTLTSPVIFRPVIDRQYVFKVFETILQVLPDFHYIRETATTDNGVLLVFQGTVKGLTIQGIDLFDLDQDGRAKKLTVMLRPLGAANVFAFEMARRLGKLTLKQRLLSKLM